MRLTVLLSAVLLATPASAGDEVTWSEHIAPLVFKHCASCHREGQAAPFPLREYKDVRKRAAMLDRVIRSRYMPPWRPAPGWGEFHGERRLTDEEIELFHRWAAGGRERGDPAREPPPPEFESGWQLGEPDLVLTMVRPFDVPADGPDLYRNFVLPLGLDHDVWVKAVEMRPSAPTVVHHCLFYLDKTGLARTLTAGGTEAGFSFMPVKTGRLGIVTVGTTPRAFPDGIAYPVDAGSDLLLHMHFHPTGKAEREQTRIGLHLAPRPEREPVTLRIPPDYGRFWGIDIPPGAEAYRIHDRFRVPVDIDLVSTGGHAHYLCRDVKALARLPDGSVKRLLWIPEWHFNWQDHYFHREPVRIPAGSFLEATLTYDNTAANPHNPHDPPRRTKWGVQSTDEMGSSLFTIVPARPEDHRRLKDAIRDHRGLPRIVRAKLRQLLLSFDTDGDGAVRRADVPALQHAPFDRIDTDLDGIATPRELDTFEVEGK